MIKEIHCPNESPQGHNFLRRPGKSQSLKLKNESSEMAPDSRWDDYNCLDPCHLLQSRPPAASLCARALQKIVFPWPL